MKRLLIISLFLPIIGFGQNMPQGINYQAVARGANGQELANESLIVKFKIMTPISSSGYIIQWEETHNLTTNDYGLFAAIIGDGTPSGGLSPSFADIDWASEAHSLKVEIDYGNGFVSMGTTQFMSVPYALSTKGDNLGNHVAGQTLDMDDNNIQNLSVIGFRNGNQLNNISTNLDGQIEFKANSDYQGNTTMVIDDDSRNVGIGVLNPAYKLDVDGDINFTGDLYKDDVLFSSDDADTDSTNELQDISLNGTSLSISQGSTVDLNLVSGGVFSDTNNITSNSGGDYTVDDFVFGSSTLDYDGTNKRRFFFDKSKGAFRSGSSGWSMLIGSNAWNEDSLGAFSFAGGSGTVASAYASTAFGLGSAASGDYSTAIGWATLASGDASFSSGMGSEAVGDYSVALGNNSKALGQNSFAVSGGHATGDASFSAGGTASGYHSTSFGAGRADSYYSTAIGFVNVGGGDPNNWIETDPLFEIGNSWDDYGNAFTVLKNGQTAIGSHDPSGYFLEVEKTDIGATCSDYDHGDLGITDVDAHLEINSSSDQTWGSSINLFEYDHNDSSFVDGWSIARKTTNGSGNSTLNINYGTSHTNNSNNIKFTFSKDGKFGVGNNNPSYHVDVNGDINFTGNIFKNGQLLNFNGNSPWVQPLVTIGTPSRLYSMFDYVGVGNRMGQMIGNQLTVPNNPLHVYGSGTSTGAGLDDGNGNSFNEVVAQFMNSESGEHTAIAISSWLDQDAVLYFSENNTAKWSIRHDEESADWGDNSLAFRAHTSSSDWSTQMSLHPTGDYNVKVNGKILCEGLVVKNSNDWPDYVFEEDYVLLSLPDLEDYILANKHLPGVKSQTVIHQEGYEVNEMIKLSFEKIEELTLHLIEANKRIGLLETEIKTLKK